MTATLQRLRSSGKWADCPAAEVDFYLARIVGDPADLDAGREVTYRLRTGDFDLLNPTPEWYERLRIKPMPRAYTPTTAPRFTCRRCGEHRDTTLRGHCDDCEG